MDAVVIAGGSPLPDEPLYSYTQGAYKALLDVAGKPMIQWILDALSGAQCVDRVLIVGLSPDLAIHCARPVFYVPDQKSMLENIRAGVKRAVELNPGTQHVLTVSSDIPGITSEMVDWVANTALQTDDDLYYNVISREVMEARYPGSRRSYIHLKDLELCGGDMNVIRAQTVTSHEALWKRLIDSRKNALKQAALLGFDTLILLMLRVLTLERGVKLVSKRLGIRGRAVVCPYAEVGMDVDKPHQLEIMRADLAQRVAA
jgi:GTP:adenosylcobinamide-phosphate guanylyltransferase